MSDDQGLSALIGAIYDAAIDPSRWDVVLHGVVGHMRTLAAKIDIVSTIPGNPPQRTILQAGMPPGSLQDYFDKYGCTNGLVQAAMLYDVDEVFSLREAIDDQFLAESRIYNEWCLPRGYTDILVGIIRRDSERRVALTAMRRDPFDDGDRARLKMLLPHLRRSVTIAQLLDNRILEPNRFQEIIEQLTAAVFLVDARGHIRHSNLAAQRMLAYGQVVSSRAGRLTTFGETENRALIDAIEMGEAASPAVRLTARDGRKFVATVLPLEKRQYGDAGAMAFDTAAVFVHEPAARIAGSGEMLGKLFELSGAEVQILLALAAGGTLQDCATRFELRLLTVDKHLRQLLAKTGTSDQAELLRKVAQLTPLFGGADPTPRPAANATETPLSSRRQAIVRLAAEGFADKQICARLAITESTVRDHWQKIFRRLGAANRTEAVTKALRRQLI